MWIWQQEQWPNFTWDNRIIEPLLRTTRLNQGVLLGKATSQSADQKHSMLDTLLANLVHSSTIEGEQLNVFSVRSSRHLSALVDLGCLVKSAAGGRSTRYLLPHKTIV